MSRLGSKKIPLTGPMSLMYLAWPRWECTCPPWKAGLRGANFALAQMLGYGDISELIEDIKDLGRQVFQDPQNYGIMLGLLYQNGRIEDFESKARTKDGSNIWVSVSARVIRKPDRTIDCVLGVVKDITSLKSMNYR